MVRYYEYEGAINDVLVKKINGFSLDGNTKSG